MFSSKRVKTLLFLFKSLIHLQYNFEHSRDNSNFTFFHVDKFLFNSVQSLSRVWLFWDPMNLSMPGFPVHHQLSEFTQTHVHWVSDAIQPSHPLLSPSPPALNLSQHQGLFKWVSSLHQMAKVLEFQLQHHPGLISLGWPGWISLQSKGLSRGSSPTPQFKSISSSVLSSLESNSHIHTWPLEKP